MTDLEKIPFYRHDLGDAELAMVREVLDQAILTSGAYSEAVERKLAERLGVRHVLATTSCTGSLHLSLLGLNIGPGDEVITTPMTFIATATAILEAGATPVLVDVEPDTGNLDLNRVADAITPRTKAIMPVHLYGLMCDMVGLRALADRHGLALIEDAAHCVEGRRDGFGPGGLGDAACFSFYATKNLTCGEGGALATNNDDLAARLRLLRHHGMTKTANDRAREGYSHWDMTLMGWKYNMSNIEAALLLPQFDRLDDKLRSRQTLAAAYAEQLRGLDGVRTPLLSAGEGCIHAHHLFPVWVEGGRRDAVIEGLKRRGVEVVVNYRAIHLLSYFAETFGYRRGDFPIAEKLGDDVLSLPFYPGMPLASVDRVVEALRATLAA